MGSVSERENERPGDNLLKSQRQEQILDLLRTSGQVHAASLRERFEVSMYTVRRDLDELADAGLLERVHGGAVSISPVPRTFDGRQTHALGEKRESALAALRLLSPDQVVIVDNGSTAELLVQNLPHGYPATFVTHSYATAAALMERAPTEVVLLGGRVDPQSHACVGASTVRAYEQITADLCFLGVWAINLGTGVRAPYYDEAVVRAAMVGSSKAVVALASSEKLGTGGGFAVAPVQALTYMSVDAATPDSLTAPFEEIGVRILRPPTT